MSEYGDLWRQTREYRQKQKEKFVAKIPLAMKKLAAAGLAYREMGHGHFRIAEAFDWWPSTGYWRKLDGTKNGYHITTLIEAAQKRTEGA